MCGFRATGIYPLNPSQVLKRLPSAHQDESPEADLTGVLVARLESLGFDQNGLTLSREAEEGELTRPVNHILSREDRLQGRELRTV